MSNPTCPHCHERITELRVEAVIAKAPRQSFKALTYYCPACSCVLSVEIQPDVLKAFLKKG
jgi:uncharacterized protein with PIN domain